MVIGVALLTFLLLRVVPGDPARMYLGVKASEEAVAALRETWGLNDPILVQLGNFLSGLVTGDLGTSLTLGLPNADLIAARLPTTLSIMAMATIFATLLASVLAIPAAIGRERLIDHAIRLVNALLQGIPTFVAGLFLLILFAVQLRWFPVGGLGANPLERLWSLVLPSFAAALVVVPALARSLRSSVIDTLDSDVIDFARSKGLSMRRMMGPYVLRNGSLAAVSILGIYVGSLAGGALIVETVFAVPGLGSLLMTAISARDFSSVQAVTVIFGVIVVGVYIITDIVYALIDPRVRQA